MRALEPAAVIFDMDGVIIDSQAAANRALVEAAAKHGVRLAVSELEDLVGASEEQFWYYVKERYRLPESIPYYAASYDETLLSPGLDTLLAELRDAGIHLALATSGSRRRMNAVIEMYGLARWLVVALCREDAALEKPAPDLFIAAADALSVSPVACLVLEDSSPGMAAARAAGMSVVGFTAYAGPTSLRRGADAYLSSFEGVGLLELQSIWQACTKSAK